MDNHIYKMLFIQDHSTAATVSFYTTVTDLHRKSCTHYVIP